MGLPVPRPSGGVGKGLCSALLAQEPSFAALALCGACHVLAGAVTLLGARPRRGSGHERAGCAGGIIPKAWHVPASPAAGGTGDAPAGSPPGCGARGVPALSAASPLGWTGSGEMGLGTARHRAPGSGLPPLRWGRQGWQRGAAALCAGAIDSGSQRKWDQSGREGGGDGARPPRPGRRGCPGTG